MICGGTNLSLTNMEVLIAVVDDVVLWAARSDETQTLKHTKNNLNGSALFNTRTVEDLIPYNSSIYDSFLFLITCGYGYLCVGGKLHSFLSGDTIARVEDGCRGNGSKHGQILQTHLRGSILT